SSNAKSDKMLPDKADVVKALRELLIGYSNSCSHMTILNTLTRHIRTSFYRSLEASFSSIKDNENNRKEFIETIDKEQQNVRLTLSVWQKGLPNVQSARELVAN